MRIDSFCRKVIIRRFIICTIWMVFFLLFTVQRWVIGSNCTSLQLIVGHILEIVNTRSSRSYVVFLSLQLNRFVSTNIPEYGKQ